MFSVTLIADCNIFFALYNFHKHVTYIDTAFSYLCICIIKIKGMKENNKATGQKYSIPSPEMLHPIFVYESHSDGTHNYGDAKVAKEQYGAIDGFCVGRHGNSYAIPTDFDTVEGEFADIVTDFTSYAKCHSERTFIVSRIRCEHSIINEEDIIPLFKDAFDLPNVQMPDEWFEELLNLESFDDYEVCPIRTDDDFVHTVLDDKSLFFLCRKFRVEIGYNLKRRLPKTRIRYVIGRDNFGYAEFGDYFFWVDNGLYVWHKEDEYKEDHNPDIVEDYFDHDCKGRGYTCRHIFAGIDTCYDDSQGSRMFTGDIVQVVYPNDNEMGTFCLASIVGKDGEGFYGFPLNNHSLTLDMCKEEGYYLKRIGTIFYQLDQCEEPEPIWEKALTYNNALRSKDKTEEIRTMAKYTPNFDKEEWKYLGLEILGIDEFNWKNN